MIRDDSYQENNFESIPEAKDIVNTQQYQNYGPGYLKEYMETNIQTLPAQFEIGDEDAVFQQQHYEIDEPDEYNHSLFYQSELKPSQSVKPLSKTQQKEIQQKCNYKNVPKQIGNYLCQSIEKNIKKEDRPEGLKNLVLERGREKKKQPNTKISQLRKACQDDRSRKFIRRFLKRQFFVDLIQSNKIQDPQQYISAIINYYASAKEPEKMIGSQLNINQSNQ